MNINSLQQKNPRGVGQWIGRHLEIHAPMAEVRCENRHNAIKSQIVGAQFSVPNCAPSRERKSESHGLGKWRGPLHSPELTSCLRHPAESVPRPTYAGNSASGSPMGPIRWYIRSLSRAESNIAEGRLLAQHWTIKPLRPVIKVATLAFIKPRDRAGANHAPGFEQAGAAHHSQKRQRIVFARCSVKGRDVHVGRAGRHGRINVNDDEFRIHKRGAKGGSGGLKKPLVVQNHSAPSTRGLPPKAQFPRNHGTTDRLACSLVSSTPLLERTLRLPDREHVAQTCRGFARVRRMLARCE